MRRPALALIAALLLLFALPDRIVTTSRSLAVAALAPTWRALHTLGAAPAKGSSSKELAQLRVENQLLRDELLRASDLKQISIGRGLSANVIYREPKGWNSFLWIDVGRLDNARLRSPVVLGESLVGLIDYVGRSQSRVRLITDPSLHPAVRVVRGSCQDRRLDQIARELEGALLGRDRLLAELAELRAELDPDGRLLYLAKGELIGGAPLLRGIGFQYDFDDEEGPARDLRSSPPLIEVGDLLFTTGMDGLFPRGLTVARVVSVAPLREGAPCFEIEARATAGSFDHLTALLVLSPIDFDRSEITLADQQLPEADANDYDTP